MEGTDRAQQGLLWECLLLKPPAPAPAPCPRPLPAAAVQAILALPDREAKLVLGSEGAALFGPTMNFYVAKGFFVKVEGGAAGLAAQLGADESVVSQELAAYNAAAAAGSDAFGKTVFPSTLDPSQPLYVARITPVIHYTMVGAGGGRGPGYRRSGGCGLQLACLFWEKARGMPAE